MGVQKIWEPTPWLVERKVEICIGYRKQHLEQ